MPDAPAVTKMISTSPKSFWQTFTWASIVLSLLAIYGTIQRAAELDILLWRSKWILLVALFAFNILGALFLLRRFSGGEGQHWIEALEFQSVSLSGKLLGAALLVIGFSLVWIVSLFIFGKVLPGVFPILWVFLWLSLSQNLQYLSRLLGQHLAVVAARA